MSPWCLASQQFHVGVSQNSGLGPLLYITSLVSCLVSRLCHLVPGGAHLQSQLPGSLRLELRKHYSRPAWPNNVCTQEYMNKEKKGKKDQLGQHSETPSQNQN
jgi:hypothetical protein